jgi:hypothetical protein
LRCSSNARPCFSLTGITSFPTVRHQPSSATLTVFGPSPLRQLVRDRIVRMLHRRVVRMLHRLKQRPLAGAPFKTRIPSARLGSRLKVFGTNDGFEVCPGPRFAFLDEPCSRIRTVHRHLVGARVVRWLPFRQLYRWSGWRTDGRRPAKPQDVRRFLSFIPLSSDHDVAVRIVAASLGPTGASSQKDRSGQVSSQLIASRPPLTLPC